VFCWTNEANLDGDCAEKLAAIEVYRRNGVLSFLGFENGGNEGRKIEYAGWGLG
jgi:hypothetical protein